jgi:hypothetical protein
MVRRSGDQSVSTSSTKTVLHKHTKPRDGQCCHLLGHIRDTYSGEVDDILLGDQRSNIVYVLQDIETYDT